MKNLILVIVILSFFLMSGVNVDGEDRVSIENVFKVDKEVVEVDSVVLEQAKIISDMRCQVSELHYMTCQITNMLKSTGDNDARRECNHRDSTRQPACRSGVTHGRGNDYHFTATTER